ncbi:MAG: hypothetical protein A2031_04620 [Deltaproteobacteria bacterium RBG_19FT_COMBO_43_11]|nr:MAG: hypothetical protein A2031_04620 [Deltaproteobacteria bacterium RBG_19FT_COMBO_43_11]
MPSFASVVFSVFILILFAGIYLTLFDLLGTLIIFLDVLAYALFTGLDRVSAQLLLFLLLISIIAETIDFFLVMKGAHQPATTKKTFWTSAIGAVAGAFILTPFFWGPGTWGGFFLGGFAVILALEIARQNKLRAPYRVSNRAIFAMAGRKMFKGLAALFMVALSLSNIYS